MVRIKHKECADPRRAYTYLDILWKIIILSSRKLIKYLTLSYTMNFFKEVVSQGRRVAVDVLHAGGIERSSPWSPDVPEELRSWLPDLFDRFPITFQ